MRVSYLELDGVKYPMCCPASVYERLEEEFGSLELMGKALTDTSNGVSSVVQAMETTLHIFLDAGRAYAARRGESVPPLPDCRLADLIDLSEFSVLDTVNGVMNDSAKREVEALPSKNEETTEEDIPAAAGRGSTSPLPGQD